MHMQGKHELSGHQLLYPQPAMDGEPIVFTGDIACKLLICVKAMYVANSSSVVMQPAESL